MPPTTPVLCSAVHCHIAAFSETRKVQLYKVILYYLLYYPVILYSS